MGNGHEDQQAQVFARGTTTPGLVALEETFPNPVQNTECGFTNLASRGNLHQIAGRAGKVSAHVPALWQGS